MSNTRTFSKQGGSPLSSARQPGLNPSRLALICAISAATSAQADVLDPAKVNLAGIEVEPTLAVAQLYDDNLYHRAENPEAFWVRTTTLQVKSAILSGPHKYGLDYRGEAGYVESSEEDDYIDHATAMRGLWELDPRHHLLLEGAYQIDHDRRDAEYILQETSDELVEEPGRFHLGSVLSRYTYGTNSSQGRFELELKSADKSYANMREITELNDLNNTYASTAFYWRLVGSLQGLLELKQGEINYDKDPASLVGADDTFDSDYADYLAGVTWQVAGSSSGTFKVGHATKDFADADRKDFAGTSWSGEFSWQPRSYSEVIFSTGRRTDESSGRGDFIDATDWGVDWRHGWTERIESRVRYLQSSETYERDPEGRDDDITRVDLDLDYAFRRWLVLGVFYTKDRYDSTIARYDYPREVAGIQLRTSL